MIDLLVVEVCHGFLMGSPQAPRHCCVFSWCPKRVPGTFQPNKFVGQPTERMVVRKRKEGKKNMQVSSSAKKKKKKIGYNSLQQISKIKEF